MKCISLKILPYLLLLLIVGRSSVSAAGAVFGVIVDPVPTAHGVRISAVVPDTPAAIAGLGVGDEIISVDAQLVPNREILRGVVEAHEPGDVVRVEAVHQGRMYVRFVELAQRQAKISSSNVEDNEIESVRDVILPAPLLEQMYQAQCRIRMQLNALPKNMQPQAVINDIQELHFLASRANTGFENWMPGEAEHVSLKFNDSRGSLVLRCHVDKLMLEVWDKEGKLLSTWALNTEEQRKALPESLLKRFRQLSW